MKYMQSYELSIIFEDDLKKYKVQITRDINGA
jgi:hypothetical protein